MKYWISETKALVEFELALWREASHTLGQIFLASFL